MQIVETVSGDRRLALEQGEFVRKMAFGNNWTYLRVAMRVALSGSSNQANSQFMIGLCNGTTNTFNSNTTTDYIGAQIGGTTSLGTATFTFNAGPPTYFTTNNQHVVTRRQNTTNTTTAIGSNTYYAGAVSGARTLIMMDFRRIGNNSVVISPWTPFSIATAQTDSTPYMLWQSAENEVNPFNTSLGAGGATIACGTTYDTISLYWNFMTPRWEISDLMAIRYI